MTSGEFKSILLPCYRSMYATAFSILRNADDASDAAQDAVSSLWQRHAGMEIPDNPPAFCNRAVRNVCLDRLRRDAGKYFDTVDSLTRISTDTASDTAASYRSTSAYLAAILSKFSDKHRKVLALSIFSELTNDEIAGITGESSENVRAILSRGRKKIKEYLNHEL